MRVLAAVLVAATTQPLVPVFVQKVIARRAGAVAYVPTRAPFRYTYRSYTWNARDRFLNIRLADRRYPLNGRHTIVFTAQPFRGNCAAGNEKSQQLDGNKVYTAGGNLAWRCIDGLKLLASGPNLPAVALGQVVASAKRVR